MIGAMAKDRQLVWRDEKGFSGWACSDCSWIRPARRMIANDKTASHDVREAFDKHKCKGHPRATKKLRRAEDVNEAAAPIAAETTEP